MNYTKLSWDKTKKLLNEITDFYSLEETKSLLIRNNYYKLFVGKAKNRTLIKHNPKLYKSVYFHTKILEETFKKQKTWKGSYNLKYRLLFLTEQSGDISSLKCKCGRKYTWNTYCRHCPEYHLTYLGKKHLPETKKKQRISAIKYIEKSIGQLAPRYNKHSIKLIEKYGKQNGYNFIHAENGGEYYIEELGYWVDGYDKDKNVVIEIDESHHFDSFGNLLQEDINRQNEIEKYLGCEFIRLRYENK